MVGTLSSVAPDIVAKASNKHKDINSVQKYFHETTSTKLLPALYIIGDSKSEANLKSCDYSEMSNDDVAVESKKSSGHDCAIKEDSKLTNWCTIL